MSDDERLIRIWNISLALEEMAKKLKLGDVFEFAVAIKFLANMPDHWLANNMQNLDETDKKVRAIACGHSAEPAEK